jgi:hypothetical protein
MNDGISGTPFDAGAALLMQPRRMIRPVPPASPSRWLGHLDCLPAAGRKSSRPAPTAPAPAATGGCNASASTEACAVPPLPLASSINSPWLDAPAALENETSKPSGGPSMYARNRLPSYRVTPLTPAFLLNRAASAMIAAKCSAARCGEASLTKTTALLGMALSGLLGETERRADRVSSA